MRTVGNLQSAPERHIGRKIHVRVGERIAVHRLRSGCNQYATLPKHMADLHACCCFRA